MEKQTEKEEEGVYENDIHDLKIDFSPIELEIAKDPNA